MAEGGVDETGEERHNKLIALLYGPGTSILRKALEHYSIAHLRGKTKNTGPIAFTDVLKSSQVKTKLKYLGSDKDKGKLINSQWNLLYGNDYPDITAPGNLDKFDITLLVKLLLTRQVSGFGSYMKFGVDGWPLERELYHRVEAHAVVIQSCRNNVVHTSQISEADFDMYFDKTKSAISFISNKLDREEEYSNIDEYRSKTSEEEVESLLEQASITEDRDEDSDTEKQKKERKIVRLYNESGCLNKDYLMKDKRTREILKTTFWGKGMVFDLTTARDGCLYLILYSKEDKEIPKVEDACEWMSTIFTELFVTDNMKQIDEQNGTPNHISVIVTIEKCEMVQSERQKLELASSLLEKDERMNLNGPVAFKAVTIRAEYAFHSKEKKKEDKRKNGFVQY